MEKLKFGVLAAGVVGLAGSFLPLTSDVSWWARRAGPDGIGVYFVIAAFAVAIVTASLAIRQGFQRWLALIALIGFAFVILKFRTQFFDLFTSQVGGQLIGVAAALGAICAGLAAWRPEPAR